MRFKKIYFSLAMSKALLLEIEQIWWLQMRKFTGILPQESLGAFFDFFAFIKNILEHKTQQCTALAYLIFFLKKIVTLLIKSFDG